MQSHATQHTVISTFADSGELTEALNSLACNQLIGMQSEHLSRLRRAYGGFELVEVGAEVTVEVPAEGSPSDGPVDGDRHLTCVGLCEVTLVRDAAALLHEVG